MAASCSWARVQTLFEGALARDRSARADWLRDACGGDETLRREVEALLDGDEDHHPIFDRRAFDHLFGGTLPPG